MHTYCMTVSLAELLTLENISHRVDDTGSGSIGRRYARTDQIAIPFAITIDFDTLASPVESATVTLRERDSMKQIRAPVRAPPALILDARSLVPLESSTQSYEYKSALL